MDETLQMMKDLTEAPGVPGQEGPVREIMARYLAPLGEVQTDNLGSIVATHTGSGAGSNAPRIVMAGHMDEVGFLVTMITPEGFLKFQTLGGWWEQVMLAQRVTVRTRKGDLVGVFGSKPPHILTADERKKMVQKDKMFIDIGVLSKQEAIDAGVRPGDPVIPICPFTQMANEKMLLAKAWDNRFGCALAIKAMQEIGSDHPNIIIGGATVQEEVGLRGAQTLGNLVNADVAISLDVGIAGDTPGVEPHEAQGKLGKGPVILIYDGSLIPNLKLRNLFVDTAEEEKIPFQYDSVSAGGTDGGRLQLAGSGVPTINIGLPARYIHSAASIIHRDDFDNAVRLLVAVLKRLDVSTVADLRV
ncbi:MAG: M42 family metallopeptidase [Chloroflexota bacterium]|nr:M42 family metallopeptidase [Chloroflexota bacterium]